MILWAMSFAEWRCSDAHCRNIVEWVDAIPVLERGRLVGFRHAECLDE